MPKMKTVKSVQARFKVTKTGKLKFHAQGRSHLLSGKTPKRKRQLALARCVDRAHEATYSVLIGV